ncbi:4-alpha-glucanotransferase [Pseudoalteromonas piratica]|uniref:4-alpha-glucanotransferase n=1 Tax=Pseudoalteromonas piratica TaxID=1348114 RepID=UPI000690944A|nr:4-alpha-glucanotransferase [Pseudoalteromonas piratica]
MNAVEQLCYLQGVALDYVDYYGQQTRISDDVRQHILKACGHDVTNQQAIRETNFRLDALPWKTLVNEFQVTSTEHALLKVRAQSYEPNKHLEIVILQGGNAFCRLAVDLSESIEVGNYVIDDVRYSEYQIDLPALEANYYQVEVVFTSQISKAQRSNATLAVAPPSCFSLNESQRPWGISCQLYTLRDKRESGFGDFSSLKELVQRSSEKGADYILLNPLHKLFAKEPERASPYSPNDRNQINPLYISPRLCIDYSLPNGEYRSEQPFIDYSEATQHKYQCFKVMYLNFCELELAKNTDRAVDFEQFVECHADWQISQYEYYLQWVAKEQLGYCQRYAKSKGMKIGLILDLAVGCTRDGEEYARNRSLFVQHANIGAPPDPWARDGQDWGLAVQDPVKLKASHYSHFIALIRANMIAGGLRIDHVMGLLRLWWCISVNNNPEGCYVYYPFQELLAILCLESHLNQCLVIGEDLGVVPDQIKHDLDAAHVYGNDIFYFEKNAEGQFLSPKEHRKHALLMVANHDVAPFYAWWQKLDIDTRAKYQLYSNDAQYGFDLTQREHDKHALINWLKEANEMPVKNDAESIYRAVVLTLATTKAQFLCLQLDDLSGETLAVNIPGTDQEYPNWRRRLSCSLAHIFGPLSSEEQAINVENRRFWQLLNARRDHVSS